MIDKFGIHKKRVRSFDIFQDDIANWLIELDVLLQTKQYKLYDSHLELLKNYIELHKLDKKGLPLNQDFFDLNLRRF